MKLKFLLFATLVFCLSLPLYPQKKFKVVIDAGHGGNNLGALFGDIAEKDLTLNLVLKLKSLFDKNKEVEVVFTRTKDVDLSAKNRVEIIEQVKPDMFISLHFNSQKFLTTNRGFEIYYPPDEIGKSSEEMIKKYDRANNSFYYGTLFKEMFFKANFHTMWKLPFNLFTQMRGLYMFDETTVPGLLLEIAYLSSPEDRACIENPEFTKDIAKYIYDVVLEIKKHSKSSF
ncbi:MAG: N-acetylmuramoyl-L-alanine amidase family protein [bacterium]